ncbi:unnamed protein product [Notodromas monacha]|uniref:Reverse transcriptase/retrotransposon-derived protein RNase H-like domain-containing protein n=1 Tax=Notodromas monacha TaxID=399045 RepID=A0A7R9BRW5_9CRUS|nr:unnamed protein product [Notodromas monacha]CAG0919488.1 unnamed protein product [Notodromas monacha]
MRQMQQFLGMATYLWAHLPTNFANAEKALCRIIPPKPAIKLNWDSKAEEAFLHIKNILADTARLERMDPTWPIAVHCNASAISLGTVLVQTNPAGNKHVIEYASRTLKDAKTRLRQKQPMLMTRPGLLGTTLGSICEGIQQHHTLHHQRVTPTAEAMFGCRTILEVDRKFRAAIDDSPIELEDIQQWADERQREISCGSRSQHTTRECLGNGALSRTTAVSTQPWVQKGTWPHPSGIGQGALWLLEIIMHMPNQRYKPLQSCNKQPIFTMPTDNPTVERSMSGDGIFDPADDRPVSCKRMCVDYDAVLTHLLHWKSDTYLWERSRPTYYENTDSFNSTKASVSRIKWKYEDFHRRRRPKTLSGKVNGLTKLAGGMRKKTSSQHSARTQQTDGFKFNSRKNKVLAAAADILGESATSSCDDAVKTDDEEIFQILDSAMVTSDDVQDDSGVKGVFREAAGAAAAVSSSSPAGLPKVGSTTSSVQGVSISSLGSKTLSGSQGSVRQLSLVELARLQGVVQKGTLGRPRGLRPSLFSGVPPTINFALHNTHAEEVPPFLKKHLRWKLSNLTPLVVRKVLGHSNLRLMKSDSTEWIGHWGKHMKAVMFKDFKAYQKINHFPGTFVIGRKDRLWKGFAQFRSKFGKNEFNFLPRTYVLPNDLRELKESMDRKGSRGQNYIVKPPASARGTGVYVVNNYSSINAERQLVVQKYITRPFLINSTKFDLRLYIFVASYNPLRLYLYRDGLVRFASEKYNSSSRTLNHQYVHLTNYSINRKSGNYQANNNINECQGHKWTLLAFWKFLRRLGVNTGLLWASIQDIVIKTILTSESTVNDMMERHVRSRYSTFELFGFDIILDETLKPWLLEVNISPSLHSSSSLDEDVKGRMLRDLFNLMMLHVPSGKLSKEEEREVVRQCRLPPDSMVSHDAVLYTDELSRTERNKHDYYQTKNRRKDYLRTILSELTPDDIRQLIVAEDELARCGDYVRIFPTQYTYLYHRFFEKPRYYNLLLDAWEFHYHSDRLAGRLLLEHYCSKKYHLQFRKDVSYRRIHVQMFLAFLLSALSEHFLVAMFVVVSMRILVMSWDAFRAVAAHVHRDESKLNAGSEIATVERSREHAAVAADVPTKESPAQPQSRTEDASGVSSAQTAQGSDDAESATETQQSRSKAALKGMPQCPFCGGQDVDKENDCCLDCGAVCQQVSQKLVDENPLPDDDNPEVQRASHAGRKVRDHEHLKSREVALRRSCGWFRSEGFCLCVEVMQKLLGELGASQETKDCLRITWHLFLRNIGYCSCGTGEQSEGNQKLQFSLQDSSLGKAVPNPVQNLNLSKVLQLMLISIYVSGEQKIEAFDLKRWLNEDHLPSTLMTRYFPSFINVNFRDLSLFTCNNFSLKPGILFSTGAFLGLEDFQDRDVSKILKRLIVEFELPLCLYGYIAALFENELPRGTSSFQDIPKSYREAMENKWGQNNYRSYYLLRFAEVIAGGMIIVAMKHLFGMNGFSEFLVATRLSAMQHCLEKYENAELEGCFRGAFNFTDWYHFFTYRDLLVKKIHPSAAICAKEYNVYEHVSLPVLLRRAQYLEGQAFAGQKLARGGLMGEALTNPESVAHVMDKKNAEQVRSIVNASLPENESFEKVIPKEVTAIFRPSLYPTRAVISAYLNILPALRRVRNLPRNQAVPAEDFVELNEDVLRQKFTDKNFNYLLDAVQYRSLSDVSPQLRKPLERFQEACESTRRSYWMFQTTRHRERLRFENLFEQLPRTYKKVAEIFANVLGCSVVHLHAESAVKVRMLNLIELWKQQRREDIKVIDAIANDLFSIFQYSWQYVDEDSVSYCPCNDLTQLWKGKMSLPLVVGKELADVIASPIAYRMTNVFWSLNLRPEHAAVMKSNLPENCVSEISVSLGPAMLTEALGTIFLCLVWSKARAASCKVMGMVVAAFITIATVNLKKRKACNLDTFENRPGRAASHARDLRSSETKHPMGRKRILYYKKPVLMQKEPLMNYQPNVKLKMPIRYLAPGEKVKTPPRRPVSHRIFTGAPRDWHSFDRREHDENDEKFHKNPGSFVKTGLENASGKTDNKGGALHRITHVVGGHSADLRNEKSAS